MKNITLYRITLKTVATLLFCTLISLKTKAQASLLDSLTLDTLTAFTSLEEALKSPEKVIKLVLKRDHLKTFPTDIFKFINLQYLDLSKNNIKEIPFQIGTLKNLQYLSVSKNGLLELPSQIGDLTNLYYLNANQNELMSIPPEIGKLVNLRNLDLWDNNVDMLPDEIRSCKKLKTVDLRAIMIPDKNQERIQFLVRNAKVYFSPYCNCQK